MQILFSTLYALLICSGRSRYTVRLPARAERVCAQGRPHGTGGTLWEGYCIRTRETGQNYDLTYIFVVFTALFCCVYSHL